jgi:hypothetical protein
MRIVELRQYTLLPGRRDELIDLFEAELSEPQEACGMRILGTFRDLDDESRFVWLRGFPSMPERARSLRAFYGGPVWQRHGPAANATMLDSDDVLLLRPAWCASGFDLASLRPGTSAAKDRALGMVEVGIVGFGEPVSPIDLRYFRDQIAPRLGEAEARVFGCLITEPSANSFPALPVREGENVLVWVAGCPTETGYEAMHGARSRLVRAISRWPGAVQERRLLRLEPTRRSAMTGTSMSAPDARSLV